MSNQENVQNDHNDQNKRTGFGVAPSPFNGVKLELGVILVLGLCLWLAAKFITANEFLQVLMLFCFAVMGTVWLIFRTKCLLDRELERKSKPEASPDQ